MPRLIHNEKDEVLSFDICPDFSGGQASAPRANLLNQNQAALLQNVEFDAQGILRTRRGTRTLETYSAVAGVTDKIRGGITINLPSNKIVTVIYNGSLYYRNNVVGSSTGIFSGGTSVFNNTSYVSTAHGATGAYYADGSSLLGFCDGATFTTISAAPIGSLVAWHTNRLFMAGIPGSPSTLRCSGLLNDRSWNPVLNSIDIGTNDGDKIVAIQPWQDYNLVVFKQNSIWMVICDPAAVNSAGQLSAAGWTIKNISYKFGCIAPRTVSVVGGDVWFLAQDGVRTVKRLVGTESQTGLEDANSSPVRDYIRRFNRDAIPLEACAITFEGFYILSLPLDGSQTTTSALVYRTNMSAWVGVWTWGATVMFPDTSSVPQRLLIGFGDTTLREWMQYYQDFAADPTTFQDNGVGVAMRVLTRAMIVGEIMSPKLGHSWEVEFANSRSANTTISSVLDSSTTSTLAAVDTQSAVGIALPAVLPWTLTGSSIKRRGSDLIGKGPFREFQFDINNTDLLPVFLRYAGIACFVQPVPKETL